MGHSTHDTSGAAARAALGLSAAFLAALAALHGLEPEFDPSWRMISEYALGRYGWVMTLAFLCWSGSVLAVLVALWPALRRTAGGRVARGWLAVIAAALAGAAVFVTDPITDPTPSFSNNAHRVCGAIVILTFPIAASLAAGSLRRHDAWASSRRSLSWATRATGIGLALYLGSIIVSRALHPGAGRVGPHVLQGWPNRLMVVLYHLWILVVASRARATEGKERA